MKKPLALVSEGIGGGELSKVAQKKCGRCSVTVKKDAFCPSCQKFFRALSGRNAALATTVRTAESHSRLLSDI
jgi:hypothetical protein